MKKRLNRREFVQTAGAAAAALAVTPVAGCKGTRSPFDPKGLPTTRLGNTGAEVPFMGIGCGSRWMSVEDDDQALEILQDALDNGLYYWDTAASYGNDRISSEERIGMILPANREKVFLVTKTGDRGGDLAKESIERSLKRLGTDYLDLVHVHSISSVEDAEQLGEKGKVLEVLHRFKGEGVIRHIGFTGHTTAEGMKRAAELYDFEAMMIALNHQSSDRSEEFEQLPVPYARDRGMGIIAMKVIRPRETVNGLAAADLVRYALSLEDFHMINVGIDSLEVLKDNLQIFRDFKPLESEKMEEIRLALQPFYRGEGIPWMDPSYVDGWQRLTYRA